MKLFKSIVILATLLPFHSVTAQITLPKIIADGMVLQRNSGVNIWGWASPKEKITLTFKNKTYNTVTDENGNWLIKLTPNAAGGPYSMKIKGKNTIVLNDILLGEVWLCAGQSNMVHQMRLHNVVYEKEIATANNSFIRQFAVPNVFNLDKPQTNVATGSWKSATSEGIMNFSAVAYFFAQKLYEKYKVPIGIVNASWGGSRIEAWMSADAFTGMNRELATIEKNKDTTYIYKLTAKRPSKISDDDDMGLIEKWYSTDYKAINWKTIAVPGYWEDQGIKNLDGVVWYRREINVPEHTANADAKLFLGRIVDSDIAYLNGVEIGRTSYMYPQRRYTIPKGLLKPGKNLLVIRVANMNGKGGFVPDKPYQLISQKDTITLDGYWKYKVGQIFSPEQKPEPEAISMHHQPTALYNAMLAPFIQYAIKGFNWYQGESNTAQPEQYTDLQNRMIADWRKKWKNNNLPFNFVQLPGYMDYNYLPEESQWAMFRESQAKTLNTTNTAMVVSIDLGEWNDIHPDRKKEVGERLALAAEKNAYNEDITASGPVLKSYKTEGNKIILTFNNTEKSLKTSDNDPPAEIAIAGEDKKFVWAHAKIDGNNLIVWNDTIPNPKYVRYAWADNPVNPNLINTYGLPAAPFRTDN